MIIVIMGVSGSGKTTIGKMLADAVQRSFLEGDSLHSKENIEKMSHGVPLADSDRASWLAAIRAHILKFSKRRENLVVICSSLPPEFIVMKSHRKRKYKEFMLRHGNSDYGLRMYLKRSAANSFVRALKAPGRSHFMKADMLPSQFEVIEEPSDAIVVDISSPSSTIMEEIQACLRKPRPILAPGAVDQNVQYKLAGGEEIHV